MGKWKNPFFHFDYAANGFFQNPDNRDRPRLSSDQLARVSRVNELPAEEFNWKVLGTTKYLVACGLIPKGAAFPDPPVVSSRPASSKKKPKKSDLGASSSRIRKRKAPTTPPRSEPSSQETESPPAPRPAPQEEEMAIGSGLRAPPSTLGSMAKTKTPESMPPSKGKEKVDCSKKRKVVFEDVPASSPPSPPQPASTSVPPTEAATSEPIPVDKGDELFALLNLLPEKVGMSAAFIDRFTSEEGWERMKRRSAKVAFGSAIRMLANTTAAAVLMHDPVLESLEKAEKLDEITQAFENSEKAWEEERANRLLEKQQMLEDLSKERLAKENSEEKVRELEKVVSEYPDRMREATSEAVHNAIEEFKATEVKELEEKASDIASSTIIYNIFCEHLDFDFSILGEDMVELVQSWKEDTDKTGDDGASPSS
ncbi:hypothetical protein PanWU01x14_030550 [Parasponia andersonii]|uniref:Uncharacterized protein n=1 Tax=Parasponia andersonii TaxID=3476 RepID=A0A2P5DUT3_PARAD|nr:hypothetical protein PanWU01x14_030550 [Parasponia andersonii]